MAAPWLSRLAVTGQTYASRSKLVGMAQATVPTRHGRLARLRPGWARSEHPVYRLESGRRVANPALRVLQKGFLPLILATAGLVALTIAVLFGPRQLLWNPEGAVTNTLGALLFALVMLQAFTGAAANILVVAQTAPVISGEVELQSWGLLRTTLLPLREIVLAKYAAALAHLRSVLAGLVVLRFASTVTGLILFAYFLREVFYFEPSRLSMWLREGMWIMPTIAVLLFGLWYVSQPFVQFLLSGAIGLVASTFSRSRSRAVAMALAGRFITWVGSIVLNVGLIYGLVFLLIVNWAESTSAPLQVFRSMPQPSPQQVAFVLGSTATLYLLVVIAVQVGLIVGGLALAQRRARRIGG